MADYRSLTIEIANHVAEVVLRGPGPGNAMGRDFWRDLPHAFGELIARDDVRCVILRGTGGEFSFGLDLSPATGVLPELAPFITGEQQAGARTKLLGLIRRMQAAITAVADCRQPVVAAITGRCIGGGVDLISACDVRLCAANAVFSVRETKLAIVADMGSLQRLPRIIGDGPTRELALTGRDFGADRALRLGLVSDVLADEPALLAAARAIAREIADNPPLAVQGTKAVLSYGQDKSVADGLEYVATWNAAFLQSKDLGEAFAAFVQKRPPVWRGE